MNKLLSALLAASLAACGQSAPNIKPPFEVTCVDVEKGVAEVKNQDGYNLDVSFDALYRPNSDDFQKWHEAEVTQIKTIDAQDKDGDLEKFNISSEDAIELAKEINSSIMEKINAR